MQKISLTGHSHSRDTLKKKKKQAPVDLSKSVERLSRSNSSGNSSGDKNFKYALYDDIENCTFRPNLKHTDGGESGGSGTAAEDSKSNFIDRQEAFERKRRSDQELSAGKNDYDATIDKKFCPACGAKQSFDDVKEKRKKCNMCQVEYRPKLAWGAVKDDFFCRQNDSFVRGGESLKQAERTVLKAERTSTREKFDAATGAIVVEDFTIGDGVWTPAAEREFFDRMKISSDKKEAKLKKLEHSLYGACKPKSLHYHHLNKK